MATGSVIVASPAAAASTSGFRPPSTLDGLRLESGNSCVASCLIYHGPGARAAALREASRIGRLLAPPFGDKGLDVESARQVVHLLSFVPVGEAKGVVVVGPMDSSHTASEKARDVLLKRIEEFPSRVQPILWANDLGDVQGTIKSRCLERWAPGKDTSEADDVILSAALGLVEAVFKREAWMIPGLVTEALKTKATKSGEKKDPKGSALLQAALDFLAESDHPDRLLLWESLRVVARYPNPTPNEVAVAFLRAF